MWANTPNGSKNNSLSFDSEPNPAQLVTMREVIRRFCPGVRVNSMGRCPCPIHGGEKPNLKIYDKTNSYYCFTCHSAGDPVRFVAELRRISYPEALRLVAGEFGVQLDDNRNEANQSNRKSQTFREREIAELNRQIIETERHKRQAAKRLKEELEELGGELVNILALLDRFRYNNEHTALIGAWYTITSDQYDRTEEELAETLDYYEDKIEWLYRRLRYQNRRRRTGA